MTNVQATNEYFNLQKQVQALFGHKESWKAYPIVDFRSFYWYTDWDNDHVHYATTEKELSDQKDNYHKADLFCVSEHCPSIYDGPGLTMVAVSTGQNGNRFMAIFDNTKERRDLLSDMCHSAMVRLAASGRLKTLITEKGN